MKNAMLSSARIDWNRTGWCRLARAIEGRPLATFCGSYLAGAASGVTFPVQSVIHACLLITALAPVMWRYRLLSASTIALGVLALWLGAVQGVRHAQTDSILWNTLPDGEPVTAIGEILSEPTLRRGIWRFIFRADQLVTAQGVVEASVDIWVTVPESRVKVLFSGERWRLEGRLRAPSVSANPASASFVQYLRRQGVVRTLQPYRMERLPTTSGRMFFSRLRQRLIHNLRTQLPAREGNIAAAIVLNDRTGLDNAIREAFQRTGTIHILSPSGTHVSLLAVAVWAFCNLMKLPRRVSAGVVIAVIWLFAGVAAGGEPSFRAAVMGTLVAGAVAFQRELDLPTSLATAGFLLVVRETGVLRDPGFQFSFTLVAAIVAGSGWLSALASGTAAGGTPSRLIRAVLTVIGLGMLCAVASAPLTALYYGQISLISPIANLVIAVPVQVMTCGGLLIACLPELPGWLTAPIALSAWAVDAGVRLLSEIPFASIAASAPTRGLICVFYVVLFTALLLLSHFASRKRPEEPV